MKIEMDDNVLYAIVVVAVCLTISTCFLSLDPAEGGQTARQWLNNRTSVTDRIYGNRKQHHLGLSDTFIRSRAVIPVTESEMEVLYNDRLKNVVDSEQPLHLRENLLESEKQQPED